MAKGVITRQGPRTLPVHLHALGKRARTITLNPIQHVPGLNIHAGIRLPLSRKVRCASKSREREGPVVYGDERRLLWPIVDPLINENRNLQRKRHKRSTSVLLQWLTEAQPDLICLQELRAAQEKFPEAAINKAG